MRFYDTLTQTIDEFNPDPTTPVRVYTCGVTPYDAAHMGHVFTFLTYDLLQRRLEDLGYSVMLARNVTDVDEPIYKRAAELSIDYRELAAAETSRLNQVLAALDFRPAYAEPKASEYIESMAEAVHTLLGSGQAYRLGDDVYFDTGHAPAFNDDAPLPRRLLVPFMSERGGDPERPGKRHPLDFLLWKGVPDTTDPIAWDSVVGRGRPGWHIECSVMSYELLGANFDIHGGGTDLIFPHHASEQAQSDALTGVRQAKRWLHVSPLQLYGEKMSKSLGNLAFAHELLERWHPDTLRIALMTYHYRDGGEWHFQRLEQADLVRLSLAKLWSCPEDALPDTGKHLQAIRSLLDDDLKTPDVVRQLSALASDTTPGGGTYADLHTMSELLGLTTLRRSSR